MSEPGHRTYSPDPTVPWPVRVLAIIVVLPFRLAWELLRVAGRLFADYVLRPAVWLFDKLVLVPVLFLWRYLVVVPACFIGRYLLVVPGLFLGRHLLVVPALFLIRYLVVVPGRFIWHVVVVPVLGFVRNYLIAPAAHGLQWMVTRLAELLTPVFVAIGRALHLLVVKPVTWLIRSLYVYFLRPGRRGAGWLLHLAYRYTLRPLGLATRWIWQNVVAPFGRAIAALARSIGRGVAAEARQVNETLIRPVATTVRQVLSAVTSWV
ncbi:hypothetical protein [Kineosporia sp. NBRC 101731]|uniref:hypothetical protein n=1 Tax=Kineosporia sp. NBRC 101731 TaxID=3032199 RepID=UPI0024A2C91E|nr:hypothetical protein [Kineosporia sp. NBRC 101731]GLY30090.1 hypothetical protein Kisp02_34550 [Kineosporia sp. NBRC 101731]